MEATAKTPTKLDTALLVLHTIIGARYLNTKLKIFPSVLLNLSGGIGHLWNYRKYIEATARTPTKLATAIPPITASNTVLANFILLILSLNSCLSFTLQRNEI